LAASCLLENGIMPSASRPGRSNTFLPSSSRVIPRIFCSLGVLEMFERGGARNAVKPPQAARTRRANFSGSGLQIPVIYEYYELLLTYSPAIRLRNENSSFLVVFF
jgi:hypothetical protein